MIQGEKQVNNMDRAAYQMLVPEYNQMRNILDLLDSLLFNAPLMYLYLRHILTD